MVNKRYISALINCCMSVTHQRPFTNDLHVYVFYFIVPCPVGTYLDKSNALKPKCKICPRGTFKDKEDGTVCTICPNGTFTLTDGAESASECISISVLHVLHF